MSHLIRTYLPLDDDELRTLDETGSLPERIRQAFAVTDRLRTVAPTEDDEGLEYLATQDAATDAATRGLRVVASVDVDADRLTDLPDADLPDAHAASAVQITGAPPKRHIASFHVLDPAGERDVDVDLELSWYDATELALVRQALG
ncbi:hypothetical protein GCM10011492_32660 [Flexivirga endophytica]|uniref:Uncharacterized protein n=1 Tax=Flexivirga endophytica TaxID=1849103 RepID=A0A916WWF0_9MICO|nr:hypothetical protein [Flexivirga endophytica]GGB39350.1 hypothetical protein GCM10011492_32660 [Flexivirga endophytica]GHB47267.1 hypothetical protein GCM10008112_15050 [Flexivirga endophytica]